jgi:hypothetical protein
MIMLLSGRPSGCLTHQGAYPDFTFIWIRIFEATAIVFFSSDFVTTAWHGTPISNPQTYFNAGYQVDFAGGGKMQTTIWVSGVHFCLNAALRSFGFLLAISTLIGSPTLMP